MKRLSKEHILMLHAQLIKEFGGSDGIRDFNLLDSALESPFQTFDGVELYPSLQAKAARLVHGTCHPASDFLYGLFMLPFPTMLRLACNMQTQQL